MCIFQDVPVAKAAPADIQDLLGGALFKALYKWMQESGPVYLLPTGLFHTHIHASSRTPHIVQCDGDNWRIDVLIVGSLPELQALSCKLRVRKATTVCSNLNYVQNLQAPHLASWSYQSLKRLSMF